MKRIIPVLLIVMSGFSPVLNAQDSVVSYYVVPTAGVVGIAASDFFGIKNLSIYSNPSDANAGKEPFAKIGNDALWINGIEVCQMSYAGPCAKEFKPESYSHCDASWWLPYFGEKKVEGKLWYLIKLRDRDGWVSADEFPEAIGIEQHLKSKSPRYLVVTRFLDDIDLYSQEGEPRKLLSEHLKVCHSHDVPEGQTNSLHLKDFKTIGTYRYADVDYDLFVCDDSGKVKHVTGEGLIRLYGQDGRPNIWIDNSCE